MPSRNHRASQTQLHGMQVCRCGSAGAGRAQSLGPNFKRLLIAACLLISILQCASAAVRDDFETADISWRPGDADAPYRVESQQRITADPHSGRASELLQISAGAGTHVYFTHEVGTARIVAELSPSVWIKANRPGIQLLARVVLPHTIDPRTGQPSATLIAGNSYSAVGTWEQLRIGDTPQLFSRQVRVLRAQLGPQVDAREAYVDQLLLNVYGGQGQTIVNIDDLQIDGVVPADPRASTAAPVSSNTAPSNSMNPNNPSPQSTSAWSTTAGGGSATALGASASAGFSAAHQVVFNSSLLLVDGRPMFPRIAQWQGEPLSWLKQDGFNVVRSAGPLTDQLLIEAQQAGIWLIGPPPQNIQTQTSNDVALLAPITPAFAPVLAWHLGSDLAARELSATAALSKQLRTADHQMHRPFVCNPEEESLPYSRLVDVLSETRFPLGTSLELKDYGAWLGQRPRLARAGTPLWAIVQTEPAPSVVAQVAALAGPTSPAPEIDIAALRLLTYQAFCAGARGIEFASNSRLDASDNGTRLRATALALLNLELDLLEPWGAAGNYVTTATPNDPDLSAVVLNTDKARLVVAMRIPEGSQYVAAPEAGGTALPQTVGALPPKDRKGQPDPNAATKDTSKLLNRTWGGGNSMADSVPDHTMLPSAINNPLFPDAPVISSQPATATLVVPGVPDDYGVFELTPAGLRPLRHKRITGGTAIAVEDFLLTSLIVITSDPTVENSLRLRAKQMAPRAAKLQRELTLLERDEVAAVDARLINHTQLPSAATALGTAGAGVQRADQLLAAGDAAQSRDELSAAGYYSQAFLAARNAAYPLEHWKRDVWEHCTKLLPSPVSSPLAVQFDTLPEQIRFAAAITGPPPGQNLLVGGDFENLQTMLQAGWQHAEHSRPDLQAAVELSPVAPYADQHSLHLQVQTVKQQTATTLAGALIESPPLWVTSAPVHVAAGDVVCIRGQVRVVQPIVGSVDGLMIFDSLGGPPLAHRFTQTDGWREFVMYRAAPSAQDITVTFALTGIGQVWIDDVSIRPIRRSDGAAPANLTSVGWPTASPAVR